MSQTGQPRLDELFRAAQECTGLTMPGLWECVGEMHLNGRCGCNPKQTANQCDGCMRGLPVRGGMHYDRQFAKPEMICTAERYTEVGE